MAKSHFQHVKKVRRRDGPGATYYYHQLTGVRLPDTYGSAEFAAEWAKQQLAAEKPRAKAYTDPGTYWSLCEAFMADGSDAWQKIGDHTRADYRKCRDWMSRQGADAKMAAELTQERCEKLLDKAIEELGFRRGMYVLQFNRRLYNWVLGRAARQRKWGSENPWMAIEKPDPPKRTAPPVHRVWHPWELREVLAASPLGLRRAYVLGACGVDSSTATRMRWDQYADGGFDVERQKTGVVSWVNVPEFLQEHLDPDGYRPGDFVATSIPGDPFTVRGLQKRSSEFLGAMAKAGTVGSGLTFHGLRHTLGKAVADAGGSLHAIQGALQHTTAQMALYYSAGADRKRALQATDSGVSDWFSLEKPKEPGWKNH